MSASNNTIVVQVLVPQDVPAGDRADFEAAAVEFLFGVDRPRPELHAELSRRGVDLNTLAAASRANALAICPDPEAMQFVPNAALAKHVTSNGISLTAGGSVQVEFDYGHANKMKYPPNTMMLHLKVPKQVAHTLTDELTGHLVTTLFGDCELPPGAQAYLNVVGVDLHDIAHRAGGAFAAKTKPPTTRVSVASAARLKSAGFDTEQFGKLQVMSVSALP